MLPTKSKFTLELPANWKLKSDTPYLLWRIGSIILIGAMVASMIGSSYFIYSHIYRTLDDVNSIVVLNSNISIDTLNLASYDRAHALVSQKVAAPTDNASLRNIFTPVATPTSSTTRQ